MKNIPKRVFLILLLFLLAAALPAQQPGIEGRPAPSWDGLEWLNLPADVAGLDVAEFRGKVL